tara:strand:- start:5860 stop:7155 length:1296 start_codon:yes stop_codon:yes gene_type:complete
VFKNNFKPALVLLVLVSFFSCKSDRDIQKDKKITDKTEIDIKDTTQSDSIEKINFYFENSGSMNGYLDGRKFKQTMHRIIDEDKVGFEPFFVNMMEYKTSNLLSKIDNKKIRTENIGGSDHKFIFENAIKNSSGNNLSIVVTDGIYSTPSGDTDIVGIDIENSFFKALSENKIETVVLKMASNYSGLYYTGSKCGTVPINQERPYYILLFGNKKIIDKALKDIVVIDELPGFKKQARFFITDNLKVNYTILTRGEEKKGSFRKSTRGGKGLVKDIEDVERDDRAAEPYIQFAIGIDYSGISIPDSYLIEKNNYKIGGTTEFDIEDIKTVKTLSKTSRTYLEIEKVNKNNSIKLSNLITVKAKFNFTGDLLINLENNIPSWIPNTGTENDCDITGNTNQTFAFDKLMTGISKAYSKINKSEDYFKLKLSINH